MALLLPLSSSLYLAPGWAPFGIWVHLISRGSQISLLSELVWFALRKPLGSAGLLGRLREPGSLGRILDVPPGGSGGWLASQRPGV